METKKQITTISLDPEVLDEITIIAKEMDLSRSACITGICRAYIAHWRDGGAEMYNYGEPAKTRKNKNKKLNNI